MPEIKPTELELSANIKVVGVGGAGGSAINRMREANLKGVELIAMNTDAQALKNSLADTKIYLGKNITNGLGAGADPEKGEQAANESRDDIKKAIEGADMVFITLGAGGGTGSGAGHVVAEISREMGILTVGIVTKPFDYEGAPRRRNAEWAIERLRQKVDALLIIPNQRLLQIIDPKTPVIEAFKIADDVLRQGVQGISGLITEEGLINLDFADVKTIMSNAGSTLMGIGRSSGEHRAVEAAKQAIESPLLEVSIEDARGVLFNIVGGYDMSMSEIEEAAELITSTVSPDANIIFGATIKPELEDEMIITVVATGFDLIYQSEEEVKEEKIEENSKDDQEEEGVEEKPKVPTDLDDPEIENIDLELDEEKESEEDIKDNGFTLDYSDDEAELPAFLARRKKKKDKKE